MTEAELLHQTGPTKTSAGAGLPAVGSSHAIMEDTRLPTRRENERTPSRERRLKRKWAIHNYNEDKKDTVKLNPFELIESSCNWMM